MKDDYSNYPKSIAEIKSEKTESGSDWNPRDALIAALRDIDTGKIDPNNLIVCWAEEKGNKHVDSSFYSATKGVMESIALLEMTKIYFMKCNIL